MSSDLLSCLEAISFPCVTLKFIWVVLVDLFIAKKKKKIKKLIPFPKGTGVGRMADASQI